MLINTIFFCLYISQEFKPARPISDCASSSTCLQNCGVCSPSHMQVLSCSTIFSLIRCGNGCSRCFLIRFYAIIVALMLQLLFCFIMFVQSCNLENEGLPVLTTNSTCMMIDAVNDTASTGMCILIMIYYGLAVA